jgi:ribose transport system permease protein
VNEVKEQAGDAARLPEEAPPRAAARPRWQTALRAAGAANASWTFVVLLVLMAGFSAARPHAFLTVFNLRSMTSDAATLLVMGVGMTYVIITGGIDLSVGSVLIFSGVLAGEVMVHLGHGAEAGWPAITAGLLVGLVSGLLWGLVNGLLIARARVPALIVTLGSYGMALGFAQIITGGTDVRSIPNRLNTTVGIGNVAGIPWVVVVAALVTLVGAAVLATTRFGRHTYAVGSNAEAARRAGIRVERHLIKVYALSGLLAGLAGDLSLARFQTTTIAGHTTDNLSAIAAVVIGGTSLFGGLGTVFGTVVGVFIPTVLQDGFVIVGVQPFWQSVAVGAVLIAAVFTDQWRRQARTRNGGG